MNPAWLDDHRVFDRVIAPGALYGAMAASAAMSEGGGTVEIGDFQLLTALAFPEDSAGGTESQADREIQLVFGQSEDSGRPVRIYSRDNESGWLQHAAGNVLVDGLRLKQARDWIWTSSGPAFRQWMSTTTTVPGRKPGWVWDRPSAH